MKKYNLELTKEQFLEIIRLSFIWEMVINWRKVDDFDMSAKQTRKHIVRQAAKNNIFDYLYNFESLDEPNISWWYDIDNEKWMEFYSLLSNYCDESFQEDLIEILGQNMVFKNYSHKQVEEMWENEYHRILEQNMNIIETELETNDYDNINFDIKNPLFSK